MPRNASQQYCELLEFRSSSFRPTLTADHDFLLLNNDSFPRWHQSDYFFATSFSFFHLHANRVQHVRVSHVFFIYSRFYQQMITASVREANSRLSLRCFCNFCIYSVIILFM